MNNYFTSMSHFLNAPWGSDYWDVNGYYYPWTNRTGEDREAMVTGGAWIFDVDWCDVEIRDDKSPAYFWRYANPSRLVSEQEYIKNADVEIRSGRFNPADNMAAYGWRKFLEAGQVEAGTSYLPAAKWQLGRVFHAIGDSTVPHHAIGLIDEGHQIYEDCVETPYVTTWKVYDSAVIREHLDHRPFLDTTKPVEEIVTGIARYVVQLERDAGRQDATPPHDFHPGKQCWPRLINLVNLAIAGNITILRKAWIEWGLQHGHLMLPISTEPLDAGPSDERTARPGSLFIRQAKAQERVRHPPAAEPPVDLNLEAAPVQARDAWPSDATDVRGVLAQTGIERDFRRRDPGSFLTPAFLRRLETAGATERGRLLETISHLRNVVADLGDRAINTERFASELRMTDEVLIELFAAVLPRQSQVEQEGAPPPREADDAEVRPPISQDVEPLYRLPTVEEIESPERWEAYAKAYEKYGTSVRLVQLSIARALLWIELSTTVDEARRKRLEPKLGSIDFRRMRLANELFRSG